MRGTKPGGYHLQDRNITFAMLLSLRTCFVELNFDTDRHNTGGTYFGFKHIAIYWSVRLNSLAAESHSFLSVIVVDVVLNIRVIKSMALVKSKTNNALPSVCGFETPKVIFSVVLSFHLL
jgi:hypothetical protein